MNDFSGDYNSDAWWLLGYIADEDKKSAAASIPSRGAMLGEYWMSHVWWLKECGFIVTMTHYGFALEW